MSDEIYTSADDVMTVEDEAPKKRSIFDLAETDLAAEENGRWFKDIFDNESDVDVCLRRLSSKASMLVRRRLDKKYRHKTDSKGEYDEDFAVDVMTEQMAHGVVVDWRGIVDNDGKDIPCTPENALKLFRALPAFRDAVIMLCNNMENYRKERKDDAAKN